MSFIYYKFKSNIEYDTVMFDGLHMSLEELKDNILLQKKMTKGGNFTLQITNAQTKEEYKDDKALIPKNTSVIVARIPISIQLKKNQEKLAKRNLAYAEPIEKVVHKVDKSSDYKRITQNSNLANMDLCEEDKIKAMMAQATQDFDPNLYPNAKFKQPPPQTYVCFKCHQPGHWIQFCPYIGDSNFENRIKRSTGIPKSFMTIVDGPGHKGALLTNEGKFAVPKIDKIAYQEKKKERPPFLPADNTNGTQGQPDSSYTDQNTILIHDMQAFAKTIKDIPPDLKCGICQNIMDDAVVIPCCGNSFCDACITRTLLDQEDHICPTCHECDILPSTLIPNQKLRKAIDTFISTRFAAWRIQNSLPSLPTNPLGPCSIYNGMPIAASIPDKLQNVSESCKPSLGNLLKPWEPSKYLNSPYNTSLPSQNTTIYSQGPFVVASSYAYVNAAAYMYPRTSVVSVLQGFPPPTHYLPAYNAGAPLLTYSLGQAYLPAPAPLVQTSTPFSTTSAILAGGHQGQSNRDAKSNVITLSPHKMADRKLTRSPLNDNSLHGSKDECDEEGNVKVDDTKGGGADQQDVDEIPRMASGEADEIAAEKVEESKKANEVKDIKHVKRRSSLTPSFKSTKPQLLRRRSSDPTLIKAPFPTTRVKSVSPLHSSRRPSYTPSSPGTKWSSKSSRRSSRSRDRSILTPRSYRNRRDLSRSRSRSRSLKHSSRSSAPRQAPLYSVSFYNNVLVPAMALAVAKRQHTHTATTTLLSSPSRRSPRHRHSPHYRTEISPRRECQNYPSPIYDVRPIRGYDYRTGSPARVNNVPTPYQPPNYESRKLRGPLLPTPTEGMSDRPGNDEESYVVYRRREQYASNGGTSRYDALEPNSHRYNAHRDAHISYPEPRYHHPHQREANVYANGRRSYHESSDADGYLRNSFSPRPMPNSPREAGFESRLQFLDVPSLASHRVSRETDGRRNYQHDDMTYTQKKTHYNDPSQYYNKNAEHNRSGHRMKFSRSPLPEKDRTLSDYEEESYERQPKSLIKRCELKISAAVKSADLANIRKDYEKKRKVKTPSPSKRRHKSRDLQRKAKLRSNDQQKRQDIASRLRSSSRDSRNEKCESKTVTKKNIKDDKDEQSISSRHALKVQRKLEKKRIKREEKMRRKEERKIAKRLLRQQNRLEEVQSKAAEPILESNSNLSTNNPCTESEISEPILNNNAKEAVLIDDSFAKINSSVSGDQVGDRILTPDLMIDALNESKEAAAEKNNNMDLGKETLDQKESLDEYSSDTDFQRLHKQPDEIDEFQTTNTLFPSKWDNVDENSDIKPENKTSNSSISFQCGRAKNAPSTNVSADILRKAEQAFTNKLTKPLIQSTSFKEIGSLTSNPANSKNYKDASVSNKRRINEKEDSSKRKRIKEHQDLEKKIKSNTSEKCPDAQCEKRKSKESEKVRKHSIKDEEGKKHKKKKDKKTKEIRRDKKEKKERHDYKKHNRKQHKT